MKKFTRLFAPLLLIVALILPLCVSATYYESNDFSGFIPSTDIYEETVSLSANEIPEALLLRDVDSGKFVKRLYEMEDEYTLAFRNEDGTNTVMMFSEPVKYRTALGEMRDKSTQTIHSGNRYVTADTDVMVSFPDSIGQSVRLQYNGLTVSMKPMGVSQNVSAVTKASELFRAADTLERESSVYTYRKVYDNHTDIVYTPTFTGVKCDILLSRNTGKNRFDFEISLNGFHLEKNENEKIIYILNTSNEVVAYFNSVMSYDSVGKVSFGDMEFVYNETNDTYIVTLIVDEEFLNDTETVYPVYVDPSITVEASKNGMLFEYLAVYSTSGSQHSTSRSGEDIILGSSYGKGNGRLLYKFPEFAHKGMQNAKIVHCVRNTSDFTSMYAYAYIGAVWGDTSSYSNVTAYDTACRFAVEYQDGDSSMPSTKYMTIDVTDFYSACTTEYTSYSLEKGLILINENGEDALEYGAIYSNVQIATTSINTPTVKSFAPYLSLTYTPYKIILDPGHSEDYGKFSFVPIGETVSAEYSEGNRMWDLSNMLKTQLEAYGFEVHKTRNTKSSDISYAERGALAAGHDLILSLHSNAATMGIGQFQTTHREVGYICATTETEEILSLAENISRVTKAVLNIEEPVLRIPRTAGQASEHPFISAANNTNCPVIMMIEHSFHDNLETVSLLVQNSILSQIAIGEASVINDYFLSRND